MKSKSDLYKDITLMMGKSIVEIGCRFTNSNATRMFSRLGVAIIKDR